MGSEPESRKSSAANAAGDVRVVHVRIEGRVQGVGYRAWTAATARELGLAGWVRNRPDGSVEAVFQGDACVVADMVARCSRGPRDARVSEVIIVGDGVGAFTGFEVKATG